MMPNEKQHSSAGLVISLIITVFLLLGALSFGFWANSERQDYKDNVEQKVSDAVTVAKQKESARKDAEFAEISKSPLKAYVGPEAFGSIKLAYPKSWNAYVKESSDGSPFIDGYFNPNFVPDAEADSSVFALRVQVSGDSYSQVMENYSSGVEDGSIKVSPFKFKKQPTIVGSKITGQIAEDKKGTLIVIPLRANSLQIWTESSKYLKDFTKYILPNFTFSP